MLCHMFCACALQERQIHAKCLGSIYPPPGSPPFVALHNTTYVRKMVSSDIQWRESLTSMHGIWMMLATEVNISPISPRFTSHGGASDL